MKQQLGKHTKRITVWNEPVGNLVELDSGQVIAIGYNRIVVADNRQELIAGNYSWDRKWNYAGLDGGGKMAQFINDFYIHKMPDQELFDVVVLIDGSSIVITADLIAQFQNYTGVDPEQVQITNDYYVKRELTERDAAKRERARLNWQAFNHESGASQWIEHVARSGPFEFNIFENGREKTTRLDPFTNQGERPDFFCSVVWHYGHKTGDYFTAGETQASAVEVAKRRAVSLMYEQIEPLHDWITNELFLMENERD